MTDYNTYYNSLANSKNVTRGDALLRCLIKAIRSKNEDKLGLAQALINRAFTPPSNPVEVANGALYYWGFHHAKAELRYMLRNGYPFEISEEETAIISLLVLNIKAPK